jgi:preprotein translocase subunit SecA
MYKKEAFEKFQILLLRLKQDITMYLVNFDFSNKPSSQPVIEIPVDSSYLDILQQASSSVKNISVKQQKKSASNIKDSDVEVFEVSSPQPESPYKNIFD